MRLIMVPLQKKDLTRFCGDTFFLTTSPAPNSIKFLPIVSEISLNMPTYYKLLNMASKPGILQI